MRLTEKYDDGSYGITKCDNSIEQKLGQLEDLEEELGIDLIIYIRMTTGTKVFAKDKSIKQKPFVVYSMNNLTAKKLAQYKGRHNDLIIYGAIWTDRGLIYVAKMNEKGELELL